MWRLLVVEVQIRAVWSDGPPRVGRMEAGDPQVNGSGDGRRPPLWG